MSRRGDRRCDSCRFWLATNGGGAFGWCKRRAPQVIGTGIDADGRPRTYTQWPRTPADQWCGEFAADEGER